MGETSSTPIIAKVTRIWHCWRRRFNSERFLVYTHCGGAEYSILCNQTNGMETGLLYRNRNVYVWNGIIPLNVDPVLIDFRAASGPS